MWVQLPPRACASVHQQQRWHDRRRASPAIYRLLTGLGPLVGAGGTATVTAFGVAVGVLGLVLVTVAILRHALSQRHHLYVLPRTMSAILA